MSQEVDFEPNPRTAAGSGSDFAERFVMWKSTLVAQLLTMVLDVSGVDPAALREAFPEEFAARTERSESDSRSRAPWRGASTELTDSVRYLIERKLIDVLPDGSLVDARTALAHEIGMRDEGLGVRVDAPGAERERGAASRVGPCRVGPFDFDVPREEV